MRILSMKRLMVTTALTLPVAAIGLPAQAQDENACARLEQFLEQDMPEGIAQTEDELNRILEEGDPEQCAVVSVEIEGAMQETEAAAAQETEEAEAEGGVLATQERAIIELSDQIVIEGEVYVEQTPPAVEVEEPDTEVVVQSPAPSVRVEEQAGEILVRQAPARIAVEMTTPTIRIEQDAPEIIITMPPPGVEVTEFQPEVTVRQSEPVVVVNRVNPTIDLELRQAEDPEAAEGVGVLDRATGEELVAGAIVESTDADVTVLQNEPIVTYEQAESEADVEIVRSQPVIRFEQSDPVVDFTPMGEPLVEFAQIGEPEVTFQEHGEGTEQAQAEEAPEEQQELTAAEEPAEETELPEAEIETAEEDTEQTTEMAQADEQAETGEAEMVAVDEGADTRPMVDREGFQMVEADQVEVETLTGQTVYDMNDEDVGDIGDLVLSADGGLEGVIIDVGGFLGLGEKPVLVDFDELSVLRQEDGDEIRVYIDATQEELEQMERYTE